MSFSDPFYTPDYFEYQWEILDFESEDPAVHARGQQALRKRADGGDTGALLVLARHYLGRRYRDADRALGCYLEAMERGSTEGWGTLQRLYAHPDDTDMEEAVRRMKEQGYTMDALKKRWQMVDPFRQ